MGKQHAKVPCSVCGAPNKLRHAKPRCTSCGGALQAAAASAQEGATAVKTAVRGLNFICIILSTNIFCYISLDWSMKARRNRPQRRSVGERRRTRRPRPETQRRRRRRRRRRRPVPPQSSAPAATRKQARRPTRRSRSAPRLPPARRRRGGRAKRARRHSSSASLSAARWWTTSRRWSPLSPRCASARAGGAPRGPACCHTARPRRLHPYRGRPPHPPGPRPRRRRPRHRGGTGSGCRTNRLNGWNPPTALGHYPLVSNLPVHRPMSFRPSAISPLRHSSP